MQPKISIIIPNYNEAENVSRGVLTHIVSYLKKQPYAWEMIVADDGSTDGSLAVISRFAAKDERVKVLRLPHAGKPYALRAGIKAAKGQYVLFTDMDQSTPIEELGKLLPWTDKGFTVVIGSRGASRENSSFFRKYIVSLGFLLVRRAIILPEIIDTQCGFKLLDTKLARTIFGKMRLFGRENNVTGWKVTAYDVELLHLAKKMGNPIKEVRVAWRDEDVSSGKSRNFIKESYEMFFEILRVRVNDLLGKYD